MNGFVEIIEKGKKVSDMNGDTGICSRVRFLEFQLVRHGLDPSAASSVAHEHPEIETFGELLEALE